MRLFPSSITLHYLLCVSNIPQIVLKSNQGLLAHPINEVIQTPAASTASIPSSSINQRGTYNVTVHRRKQLSLTEFPNANRDLDDGLLTPQQSSRTLTTGRDNIHLLGLRSDPSVVSLLDMYDEHGCIPAAAFSNSPPSCQKQERAQTQRNGSTLRQLLGNPPSLNSRAGNDASEGDISWAERFLRYCFASLITTIAYYGDLVKSAVYRPLLLSDHQSHPTLCSIPNYHVISMIPHSFQMTIFRRLHTKILRSLQWRSNLV